MINNYKILNEVIVAWNDSENTQDDGIISTDSVSESMFKVPRCITYPWLDWAIDGDMIKYIRGYNNYKTAEWVMNTYNIEPLFRKIKKQLDKAEKDGYCDALLGWFAEGGQDDHCELNKNTFRGMQYLINHVLWDIDHWTNREIRQEYQKELQQYIVLSKFFNEIFSDPEIEKICKKETDNIPEKDRKVFTGRRIMHIYIHEDKNGSWVEWTICSCLVPYREIFENKLEDVCKKWDVNIKRDSQSWGVGEYASVSFYINIPPEFFK